MRAELLRVNEFDGFRRAHRQNPAAQEGGGHAQNFLRNIECIHLKFSKWEAVIDRGAIK